MWSLIIIRTAVALIFLSEGVQKFLFPELRGVGRFAEIGIPYPEFTSSMVGSFEIVCGILVLIGLATRFAAVPLLIIMIIAIAVTKIAHIPEQGFWEIAHEARTDFAMLLSNLFLIFTGSGSLSVDNMFKNKKLNQ